MCIEGLLIISGILRVACPIFVHLFILRFNFKKALVKNLKFVFGKDYVLVKILT